MPPKKGKCSVKALKKPAAPADSSSDDDREPINVYLPSEVSCQQQEDTAVLSEDSDVASSQASQTSATLGQSAQKAKSRAVILSPEQEQNVADWNKERDWLYNFRLAAYKDTGRKNNACDDKAAELGITSAELRTWVKSKKDLAAKILKQKTSSSEAKTLTEREQWVCDSFCQAAGFVKCVAKHKRKKARQLPPLKTTVVEPTEGSMQPLHSDAEDDVVSEAASSGSRSQATQSSSATKDQLTEQADQLVTMLRGHNCTPDSHDGQQRALADLLYHTCGRMDDDKFDEFKVQFYTLILNYRQPLFNEGSHNEISLQ